MSTSRDYPDGRAVENAIKQAASSAPHAVRSRALQIVTRDRFLCRIFASDPNGWALKGGTGMLARIPQARATRDIDLLANALDIDAAITRLTQMVATDLGDHFRFTLNERQSIGRGEQQPYIDGARITYTVRIGAKQHSMLPIDLVVGPSATAEFETRAPADRIDIPRLRTFPYRLYAVVDQIADKVCAVIESHPSGASTRQRDLIDLALLALNEVIDGQALQLALRSELARRKIGPIDEFRTPKSWGAQYAQLARELDALSNYRDVGSARSLVAGLVEPALRSSNFTGRWNPSQAAWNPI